MSRTPPTPEHITVNITALAAGGSCVGDVLEPDPHTGKKAFVPYTIPGEQAIAAITRKKKSFVEGDLVSITRPSSHRIAPPCPVFGRCGGCDLQHVELPHQREMKRAMVADLLRVQAALTPQTDVRVLAPELEGFNYRRRMSFHLNRDRQFGLYRKHGRQIAEIDHCPISSAAINTFLKENIELIKGCAPEIETVTVEDHDGTIYLALEAHPRQTEPMSTLKDKKEFSELEHRIPNLQVNVRNRPVYRTSGPLESGPPVGHFSQNNKAANETMLEEIARHITAEKVTDLYAGAGNISLPLAAKGHIVTAVELNPHLVAFGIERAKMLGLSERVSFVTKSCEKWAETGDPGPAVVLDPPRGGALEVVQRLDPARTPVAVYVSCYPPTFARDAQVLVQRGYVLEQVAVLDMFPQTYHAELVAVFRDA